MHPLILQVAGVLINLESNLFDNRRRPNFIWLIDFSPLFFCPHNTWLLNRLIHSKLINQHMFKQIREKENFS